MKRRIKFIAFLLSAVLLFGCGAVGCSGSSDKPDLSSSASVNSENVEYTTKALTYEPLSAGKESLLYGNPDRGFRTEMLFNIFDKHPDPENEGKYTDTCDLINANGSYNSKSKCSGKHDVRYVYANLSDEYIKRIIEYIFKIYFPSRAECQSKLALVFVGFPDYNKCDLPDNCINVLQLLCDRFRKQGAKMLWRHSYCPPWLNWTLSEENKKILLEECADQKTMFRHIDQLAPFFKKNIDVIHKFSSGFIGNGEFTMNWQYPVIDTNALIKRVVDTWCVPNNLYYTVRLPSYKIQLAEAEPDYKHLDIIGINNDAIFGEQTNSGWNSACYQKNHNGSIRETGCTRGAGHVANGWWEYVYENAAYTPQSGEMYVNSNHLSTNRVPTGIEVILELARHRYTSFSQWHCYLETGSANSIINGWIKNESITPEILDNESILYDPNWFVDQNGNEVKRNPYEFIRDHLGYKVVAQSAEITENYSKGSSISIDLKLKNYGFAAAFNMKSGFAILDENYKLVSFVEAGEPETWYSHDPQDHLDTNAIEHTVSGQVKLPVENGKYYIAFYLKNSADQYARLSNTSSSLPFEGDGYNILHEIETK